MLGRREPTDPVERMAKIVLFIVSLGIVAYVTIQMKLGNDEPMQNAAELYGR